MINTKHFSRILLNKYGNNITQNQIIEIVNSKLFKKESEFYICLKQEISIVFDVSIKQLEYKKRSNDLISYAKATFCYLMQKHTLWHNADISKEIGMKRPNVTSRIAMINSSKLAMDKWNRDNFAKVLQVEENLINKGYL